MFFYFLQSNPAVRLVFPLLLGIYIGVFITVESFYILVILAFFVFINLISVYKKTINNTFCAIIATFFFIFLGVFLVQFQREKYTLPAFLDRHYVKAIVRTKPIERSNSTVVLLEVLQLKKDEGVLDTHFKSLAYFPKDSNILEWSYGDTIFTDLQFSSLRENTNPYTFNYAKLLSRRQIYCTAWGGGELIDRAVCKSFSVRSYAQMIQQQLSTRLGEFLPNAEAKGFLLAMTLGDKTTLSPEVRIDFSDTGVVHILAVSGLHVGILFLLINFFLGPLRKTKRGRLALVLFGIIVIWAFAFISGLSISILRAAVMFSLLQLSYLTLRPYRIYNAIAFSAIILLLINPFYIFEIGFQLSYAAVLSIVAFVPLWDKRTFKARWTNKLKKIIFVSLAAQLGVAPLVLYYFHHLPTYFLLANVVVLVLTPFMLGGSLLTLIFSFFPPLAHILGTIVSFLTQVCILIINSIASLSYATLINYKLDSFQLLFLYLFIFFILFYTLRRKHNYFYLVLGSLFLFIGQAALRNQQEQKQKLLVIHQVRASSCYSLIRGRDAILLSDYRFTEKDKEYVFLPLWKARGIRNIKKYTLENTESIGNRFTYVNGHFLFKGKHIVFDTNEEKQFLVAHSIDILVLSEHSNYKLLLNNYIPKEIVLDSSFKKWQSQKLREKLLALAIPIYDINAEGAYVLD